MVYFTQKRLETLFHKFSKQKIVVIGDLMLDRYIWGRVTRISPEAPVPVVNVDSESFRFGGAANVAYNVKTLGAEVIPIGLIGNDSSGERLKELFENVHLPHDGLIIDENRPTTVKTRIIAHSQHVVRTDRELRGIISKKIERLLLNYISQHLDSVDGIILEDYNKGLLVSHFIHEVIDLANKKNIKVFVDPKFDHFFDYKNVTVFKPNRKEVIDRMGVRLDTPENLEEVGAKLIEKMHCQALLITMGEEGMILFEEGKPSIKAPTRAVKVHDVSGAGDTVIASMAVAMTAGASLQEATTIANYAAGIVCGEVGIVPVDKEKLYQSLREDVVS